MLKLKHISFLFVVLLLQACVSSKSTIAADSGSDTQPDSLVVKRSQSLEESGIKMNHQAEKKSIVTQEKKKK